MGEPTEAALKVLVEKYGIPEKEVIFDMMLIYYIET